MVTCSGWRTRDAFRTYDLNLRPGLPACGEAAGVPHPRVTAVAARQPSRTAADGSAVTRPGRVEQRRHGFLLLFVQRRPLLYRRDDVCHQPLVAQHCAECGRLRIIPRVALKPAIRCIGS